MTPSLQTGRQQAYSRWQETKEFILNHGCWFDCHPTGRANPPSHYPIKEMRGPIQSNNDCGLFTVLCMEAVSQLAPLVWPSDGDWAVARRQERAQAMLLAFR